MEYDLQRPPISIAFRAAPLFFGTVLFGACAAWIALGPQTDGPVGAIVGGRGRMTLLGVSAAAGALILSAWFAFYAVRSAIGRPALVADDAELRVRTIPFKTYPLSQLADIRIEGDSLMIVPRHGKARKIRLALLADCDDALLRIRELLAKEQERKS
ncbi:hypothetical protein H9L12_00940 [Sphingomonas rhizophila]|uniref:Uncharacterized protein n=1 Tax=Sphingomonas rhizophila TaxID=2071607 RepID=A0A7G9SBM3_9SPHN|nr:hypothetical protein [Sphingomonas rhizophila]QNN65248.1 hypothetical protein H9L12_00940 [Sphingomonas rhizophila]